MLHLNNVTAFSSEEVKIDEFTQSVVWNYLGKPTYYYWEAGDKKSLFQVGLHKGGRVSYVTLIVADNIEQMPNLAILADVQQENIVEGIPIFVDIQENSGEIIRSGLAFTVIIGKSQLGIVLDAFKNVEPDMYVSTERVVFAFHDRNLIATYITDLQLLELEAIRWKYLK